MFCFDAVYLNGKLWWLYQVQIKRPAGGIQAKGLVFG